MEIPPNIWLSRSCKKKLKRNRNTQKRRKKSIGPNGSSTREARLQGGLHVETAMNTTEESVLMEVRPSIGLSLSEKQRFKRKKSNCRRMKENVDPNVSTPTIEAPLQGGPQVEPSGVEVQSNIGLSRSRKRRSKRKRKKHTKRRENFDPHRSSTIEPPANISIAIEQLSLSLNSDICTSKQKQKKCKLDPDMVVQSNFGLSRSQEKKRKRNKEKRTTKNTGSQEKKRKRKKEKRTTENTAPNESFPTSEAPLQGASHEEPAIKATVESVLMEVQANIALPRAQKRGWRWRKKCSKQKKWKKNGDPHGISTIEPLANRIAMELSALSLNSDFPSAEKKRKIERKLDPEGTPSIEAPAEISIARDMSELSFDNDLCRSAENIRTNGNRGDADSSINHVSPGEAQPKIHITCLDGGPTSLEIHKEECLDGPSENLLDKVPQEALATCLHAKTPCNESDEVRQMNNQKEISEDRLTKGVFVLEFPKEHLDSKHSGKSSGFQTNANGEIKVEGIVQSLSHLRVTEDNIDLDATSNEDCIPKKPRLSPELAWISPKKKLLVLDINGILVDIIQGSCKGYKSGFRIAGKPAFKRPHCDDFLHFCFDRFHVGVWSSRAKENLNKAVDKLFGNFKHKLCFKWDRSHCTITKFRTVEDKHKQLVLKEMKKLWNERDHGLPWNNGDYNESNTLLIDDSPYKALRNPAHTAIFPYSYQHTDETDFLLGPGSVLRIYLERIEQADNVQNFVEQNPFGQPAITESHPSWDFYSQIIKSDEPHANLEQHCGIT